MEKDRVNQSKNVPLLKGSLTLLWKIHDPEKQQSSQKIKSEIIQQFFIVPLHHTNLFKVLQEATKVFCYAN